MSGADEARPEGVARALSRVPSGLFVLTAGAGEQATGMLASWVQQVGFEPPTVMVALKKGRAIEELVRREGVFCLAVLDEQSKPLMGHFARGFAPGEPAFEGLDVATSAEAEVFGAALFGLDVDTFYARLCSIADSLPNAIGTDGHRMPGELPLEDSNACAGAGPEPVAATAVEAFLAPHLAAASVPAASGAPMASGASGTPRKESCGASCSCSSPALDGGSL